MIWQEKVDMHAKLEKKILTSAHAFASAEDQLEVRMHPIYNDYFGHCTQQVQSRLGACKAIHDLA